MMSAIENVQNELITPERLAPAIEPYVQTIQNSKTHLLTPAQSNGLVLILVEIFMENYTNKDGMKLLASMLNTSAYDELCTERIINHYCGYPMCSHYDPAQIKSSSRRTNLKFLDSYYKTSYCCKQHYQSNVFFQRQLTDEAIFLRLDLFQIQDKIIFLDELLGEISQQKNKDKSMLSVIETMRNLSISAPNTSKNNDLAGLVERFEIVESENVPPPSGKMIIEDGYGLRDDNDDDDDDMDQQMKGMTIEGYVMN